MPLADYLDQLARVEIKAPAATGFATKRGDTWDPVPGLEAVPCLVRPLRAEAVARQARDAEKVWVRIYFDPDLDTELYREHRLLIDGKYYAVQGQLDFNSMGECVAVDAYRTPA